MEELYPFGQSNPFGLNSVQSSKEHNYNMNQSYSETELGG